MCDDLAIAAWIRDTTPHSAVFLRPEREMSPVLALAGGVTFSASFSTAFEFDLNRTTVSGLTREYCEVEDNSAEFEDITFFHRAENGRGPCADVKLAESRWRSVTVIGGSTIYEQRRHDLAILKTQG
jgi:hypothetical protein